MDFVASLKENKELFATAGGILTAFLGVLAAVIGRQKVVIHKTEGVPAAAHAPDSSSEPRRSLVPGKFIVVALVAGIIVAAIVMLVLSTRDQATPSGPTSDTPANPPVTAPTPVPKIVNVPPPPTYQPGDVHVLKYGHPQVEMRFRWIPPGKFKRGGGKSDDTQPVREITISKGFWMAETECTQVQWRAIMKANPDPSQFKGDKFPVEQVSANDVEEFCKSLAAITSTPIRLPSEAEWEYACRAGTTTDYHTGNGEDALKRAGWYEGNSDNKTHPVGELAANAWGLKDMHGNVLEWCQDGYEADFYGKSSATDPICGPNQTDKNVLRGGAWTSIPGYCLAAFRYGIARSTRYRDLGFRVCFRAE